MYSDSENAIRCMDILKEAVGTVDMERFISYVIRESSDYTLWRRRIYDDLTLDEIKEMAKQDATDNPFERFLVSDFRVRLCRDILGSPEIAG